MRQGVSRIVPARVLPLFSWQEAERLVSGVADVDVNVLRRKVDLSQGGLAPDDAHILMLWHVLEEARDARGAAVCTWAVGAGCVGGFLAGLAGPRPRLTPCMAVGWVVSRAAGVHAG